MAGPCIASRVIAFVLIGGSAAFSQSVPATAERLTFDPKLCKEGERDKIYVSLGRYVFPMEYAEQQAVVYDPLLPHESRRVLRPPNPEEPKGCFGNPLQSGSYALFTPAILAKGGQLVSFASALQLLTLHSIDRSGQKADTIWMGEASQLGIAGSTCRQSAIREELPNGMSVCRVRPNDSTIPQEEWGATYTARPGVYETPTNRAFVVNCSGTRFPCDIAYEVTHDVCVSYRLFPHYKGSSAPIDRIIEIDQSIRTTISASIVRDYPWPDPVMDSR